ncbi:MAG TPA: MMPL family transporter [Steroidobacteraceae bacterium]|nr:MMPL family transporter [Steroidobacteraceae bacterium]
MNRASPRRGIILGVWAALLAVSALLVARAHYRADLSAFLPRSPSPIQQLLVRQLSSGVASRLILIGIGGGTRETRAAASRALAMRLAGSPAFVLVQNGTEGSSQREQRFAFEHRYLLSDEVDAARFSSAGLRQAIEASLALMASPAGLLLRPLFERDPTGETLQVVDQLTSGYQPHREQGVWSSRTGDQALLLAETRASGADTDAQERDLSLIRAAFTASAATAATPHGTPLHLIMSGPGVFSVQARATIKGEAVRLSLISTVLIATLLLAAYRSVTTLLLGLLPVLCGALAGIAAVSVGFGVVHGITLGFGITLIGESVDYPVYLFVQSRGHDLHAVLWPTITLGALTSICGFASLLPSAFVGLAQLGLYSICGLAVAAAITRWVLPLLLPARLSMADLAAIGARAARALSHLRLPWGVAGALVVLAVVILVHQRAVLWNRDLAALSPIPAAALRLDGQMRADLGAPDVSDLVLIESDGEQPTLEAVEAVSARLDRLVDAGVIAGYDSPARFLPSLTTQQARLTSLPDAATLKSRLAAATADLGLAPHALDGFVQDVEAARRAGPITRQSLGDSALGLTVDATLWSQGDQWRAVLPLHPPPGHDIDLSRVRAALAGASGGARVQVFNTREQSDAMYEEYLNAALRLSGLGLAAIVVLLALTLRSARRVLRVLAPLLLAVLAVTAGFAVLQVPLTLLHLIGLLLIVAVGSNYALFFDRSAVMHERAELPRMLASLLLANASTVLGFCVLAFSSVPVLNALGRTVAPGTLLALLLAAALAPRELLAAPGSAVHADER